MHYTSRKDGGVFVGNTKTQPKKGRTFIYATKEEALLKHPDSEPIFRHGSWKVEY